MATTLTEEQVTALRRQLARVSSGQSASSRLLAVLANEAIVSDWDGDVVALRGYLLRTKQLDVELRELVASSVSWESLVAAARKHRERLTDDAKRRSLVVEKAAALLAGILGAHAGGLGTVGGARVSDAKARMIWAAAGVWILRDLWNNRRDSTVISAMRLGARLVRRLIVNRGWETVAAGLAARTVFAGMPKMKASRTGVVATAPVEVGGVLV
jgi:hypothetical protein